MSKKRGLFKYIMIITTLFMTITVAIVSVFGVSMLFGGGNNLIIILMASGIEITKLVVASFLYRYWNNVYGIFKGYLILMVLVIMLITSMGTYGFLSSAYSSTSTKLETIGKKIEYLNLTKKQKQDDYNRYKERYNILSDVRHQQETRLDTLYNRKSTVSAKRTEELINKTNSDIVRVDSSMSILNVEISTIDVEILSLQNDNISGEVGPLKYISKLTGKSMDEVSSWFIFLLIIVFDPLAIALVISTNLVLKKEFEKMDVSEEKKTSNPKEEHIHKLFNIKRRKKMMTTGNINRNLEEEQEEQELQKIEEKPLIEKETSIEENVADIKEEIKIEETKEEPHWKQTTGGGVRA